MSCLSCGRGFHKECVRKKGCKSCHKDAQPKPIFVIEEDTPVAQAPQARKRGGAALKLKDPKSTGRKRAAILYPIDKEQPCEWQNKKNCGGGKRPIVGCTTGLQVHRHHGPVKDTTKNHEGNVHRICTRCHNHWHELNDLVYDPQAFGLLPHDPSEATIEELVKDELEWRTGAIGKKYQLASSENHKKNRAKSKT